MSDAAFDESYNRRFAERWEFERSDDGILIVKYKQVDTSVRDADGFSVPRTQLNPGASVGPVIQRSEPVWTQIAADQANKVVILTGHNGTFYNSHEMYFRQGYWDATLWQKTLQHLPRAIGAFLDLPTLTIGAAIGEATVHAEYLLLCDLVVAGESAVFGDKAHFAQNTVPGDGVNIFWPLLLGWNRGRDLLLTDRRLSAHEALDLGLVREVVPDDQVLPRCQELAREMLKQDELTIRLTARVLRQQLKVLVTEHLQQSLAIEGIVFMDQSQRGPR